MKGDEMHRAGSIPAVRLRGIVPYHLRGPGFGTGIGKTMLGNGSQRPATHTARLICTLAMTDGFTHERDRHGRLK